MKKRFPASKILSVLIAALILLGAMPRPDIGAYALAGTSIADTATALDYMDWFPESSNRFSGGVFVDKSVYTSSQIDGGGFSDIAGKLRLGQDNFGNENFLVSMSAIGSNTEIVGYSVTPTDTMLVLDVSGSMSDEDLKAMVKSANRAIETLLSLNLHNRVGVVLYSGSTSFDSSPVSSASVVLKLGRYTTEITETENENGKSVLHDVFLQYLGDTVYVARRTRYNTITAGVKAEGSESYIYDSKRADGGTYIQNGLYKAYKQFPSGEDTVINDGEIQAGTQRMPIIVLMSDGAPTTATASYNNVGASHIGNGLTSHATASVGFLTQLTASWVKANLKTKYNGAEPKFYTLGLGTSNDKTATGVLNPSSNANNAEKYWNTFLSSGNNTVSLINPIDGDSVSVSPLDESKLTKNYVTQYRSASNASGLIKAFGEIVDEIIIQSRYYATLVSDGRHEFGGYVSFTDEIGQYMEVKSVKGIHIGEELIDGSKFAEFAVTGKIGGKNIEEKEKDKLNTAITEAFTKRFNISASEAALLYKSAKDSGYISYTSSEEFSNYAAWYASEDNTYIAPYSGGENPPLNAYYIVKSYFYLGDVQTSHTKSNMLYALVRVREEISSGRQTVDVNLPSSVLPLITYTVQVDSNEISSANIISMTNNANERKPASIIYEVGVSDELSPRNINEKIPASQQSSLKDENGDYVFYTNRWQTGSGNNAEKFSLPSAENIDPDIFGSGTIGTTAAHFVPSLQNEKYYYTVDTPVLVRSSGEAYTRYTGAKPLAGDGNSYYYSYTYIEKLGGAYIIKTQYNPIDSNEIGEVKETENGWCIKAGTPKQYYGIAPDVHDPYGLHRHKDGAVDELHEKGGATDTLSWSSWYQTAYNRLQGKEGYHVIAYLGNNGKVKASPFEGIKLTKTVSCEGDANYTQFDFDIKLTAAEGAAAVQSVVYYCEGESLAKTAEVKNGVVTLSVTPGKAVYIELPAGTKYEVLEKYTPEYVASGINTKGTITKNTTSEVSFINTPRGKGSLLVTKTVTHSLTDSESVNALQNKQFDFSVTFTGNENDINAIQASGDFAKDGNTYKFSLKHGASALFTDIPEGVEYSVSESELPEGFEIKSSEGTEGVISKDSQSTAEFINEYKPDSVPFNIELTGNKYLSSWPDNASFQIALQQVDLSGDTLRTVGNPEIIGTVTKDSLSYAYEMGSFTAESTGTYSFIVYEVKPESPVPEITYDSSFALFSVYVTDKDADGKLEIDNVSVAANSAKLSLDESGWAVSKDFTNLNNAASLQIALRKTVNGTFDKTSLCSEIMFAMFESDESEEPSYFALTDSNGKAVINYNIEREECQTEKYFYIREAAPSISERTVGMTYDESFKYVIGVKWTDADPEIKIYHYDINSSNKLGAEITDYDFEKNPLVINNLYDESVASDPEIVIKGTKTLNGQSLRSGDSFDFILYETGANFDTSNAKILKTASVSANMQEIELSGVKFNSPGIKYLVLREDIKNENGITSDESEYRITANIIKAEASDGKTVLKAESVSGEKFGSSSELEIALADGKYTVLGADFDNIYEINDKKTLTLSGRKELSGRNLVEGEFSFGLYDESGDLIDEARNDANGGFAFKELEFTSPVSLKEYKIKEIIPQDAVNFVKDAVTYDTREYTVTVSALDNEKGGLELSALYDGSDIENADFVFRNEYCAKPAKAVFSGTKHLEGRNLRNGEFEFRLYETGEDFTVSDKDAYIAFCKNSESGSYGINVYYSKVNEGVHYYVLSEFIPEKANGVSYDTREYHITVTVCDNGKGEMTAEEIIECPGESGELTANALDFYNSYNAKPAQFDISGKKIFDGELKQDMFTFVLKDGEGNIIDNAANNENGGFAFETLEITKEGEYVYSVSEERGGETAGGILYDDSVYTLILTVEDNGEGELFVAESEILDPYENSVSKIEFKNTLIKDTNLVLRIEKTVKNIGNDEISPQGFEFVLEDTQSGNKETAVSDKDGNAEILLRLTSEDIGKTFKYKLYEAKGDNKKVTYSDKVYNIEAKISLDENNKPKADLTVNGKEAISVLAKFENVYDSSPIIPITGDRAGIYLWSLMFIFSGVIAVLIYLFYRKAKKS